MSRLVTSVAPAPLTGNGAPVPVMTDDVDTQQETPEFPVAKKIREQVVDTIMDSPHPRAEALVGVSVPQIMEDTVGVAPAALFVDVLVPKIKGRNRRSRQGASEGTSSRANR